jgi:hypothetical protein
VPRVLASVHSSLDASNHTQPERGNLMRRSSKRLGQVLESYEHAAVLREVRPGAPMVRPPLVSDEDLDAADPAVHEAYREGVAEQAATYLEGLRGGERVMMHFEYQMLSPIDGGPRDIDVLDLLRELCRKNGFAFESEPVDDIGVHLTPTAAPPVPPIPLRGLRPR